MKSLVFVSFVIASFAPAAPARTPASVDRDAATLVELQRTLELAAAAEDQKTPAEAPIVERAQMQAADHPEFREN